MLYAKVASDAIMMIEEHGNYHWTKAKIAMDGFFADRPEVMQSPKEYSRKNDVV